MILLYSTHQDAKLRIVTFIQSQTQDTIAVAATPEEIAELARKNRPQTIFLHMPAKPGTGRDIQSYLHGLLPQSRVRLLPYVHKTEQPIEDWKEVIAKALRPRPARPSHIGEEERR
jgi:hypothetical protein